MNVKKGLLFVALVLLCLSPIIGAQEFREKVGQHCGNSAEFVQRVDWVWDWLANRDDGKAFVDCVGPSEYVAYRPFDLAGLVLFASTALFMAARRIRPKS